MRARAHTHLFISCSLSLYLAPPVCCKLCLTVLSLRPQMLSCCLIYFLCYHFPHQLSETAHARRGHVGSSFQAPPGTRQTTCHSVYSRANRVQNQTGRRQISQARKNEGTFIYFGVYSSFSKPAWYLSNPAC